MDVYNNQYVNKRTDFADFEDEDFRFDRESRDDSYNEKYSDEEENESLATNQFHDFPYSSIGVYLKEIGCVTLLTPEEEQGLARKIEERTGII